jgi:hypothetical protein
MRLLTTRVTGAFLALCFAAAGQVQASVITLPASSFDSTEGNIQFAGFDSSPFRSQWLYESSLFSSGPITITGLRLRSGGGVTSSTSPFSSTDFRIDVSSTVSTASTLVPLLDDNHGLDRSTVYDGAVSITFPTGSLPNGFGSTVIFDAPFDYDPGLGNSLIIDFMNLGPSSGLLLADRDTSPLAAGTGTALSTGYVGQQDALVLQLETVPEPTSLASATSLAIIGLASLGVRRRRRV